MKDVDYNSDIYINEEVGRDIDKQFKSCKNCKLRGKGPLKICKDPILQKQTHICGYFEQIEDED